MIFEVYRNMKPPIGKRASYSLKRYSVRAEILKYLHCRHMLIIISSLVVMECMCVMSELMVDLHGIRVRFENEEKQILKFVTFMRSKQPDLYAKMDGHTLDEVLQILKETLTLWDPKAESKCNCENQNVSNGRSSELKSRVRRNSARRNVRFRNTVRSDIKRNGRNSDVGKDHVGLEFQLGKSGLKELNSNVAVDGRFRKPKFLGDKYLQTSHSSKEVSSKDHTVPAYDNVDEDKSETHYYDKHISEKIFTMNNGVGMDAGETKNHVTVTSANHFSLFDRNKIGNSEIHGPVKTPGTRDPALHDGGDRDINENRDFSRTMAYKDSTIGYDQGVLPQFNTVQFVPVDMKSETLALELPEATPKATSLTDHGIKSVRYRRSPTQNFSFAPDIFVFAVNTDIENYYLVTEFNPLQDTNISQNVHTDILAFQKEYEKYQNISTSLTYVGFAIFSLMLLEIVVKLACLGLRFFKKKIDVFDAFIVVVSFALDAVFLDSKWYETGKGATTILVLLLPWRVVRIVNSFLITLNHKHYIEVMTIRRAKKKCEIKISRLKELVMALRRDIDLLVNLSKAKGATDPEIAACIYFYVVNEDHNRFMPRWHYVNAVVPTSFLCPYYILIRSDGRGRCTATLAAITSFASLMFISTLGKKDPFENNFRDDLYGNIIQDIFDDVDDETDTDKGTSTIMITKDDDENDMEDGSEHDEIYTVTQSLKKVGSRKKTESKFTSQRRATIPRRHVSCSEDDKPTSCSYVNDGYVIGDEMKQEAGNGCITKSLQFKSMPSLQREASPGNGNVLTFEVRTQVSYL